MASQTELENLIVRLTAEVDNYVKPMQHAAKETENAADHIEKASKKIEHFKYHIEGFGETLTKTLAVVGVAAGFHEAMEKFEKYEMGMIRLNAVLETNGREVGDTTREYKAFAKEMSETTLQTKTQTMNLLKTAETYGLTGTAAKQAAKESAALATLNDTSAESMMRMAAKMAEGDVRGAMMFARMIPQLRGVKDEHEFLEKYQKLVEAGTKTMGEEMETASGRLEHAKNQMSWLGTEIGGTLVKAVNPLIKGAESLVKWFNNLSEGSKQLVTSVLAVIAVLTALVVILPKIAAGLSLLAMNPLTWVVAGIVGIFLLGKGLADLSGITDEYNEKLKETKKLTDAVNTHVDPTMPGLLDKQSRVDELTRQRDAELARVHAKPYLFQTVGESLGKTTEEYDKKIAELQKNASDAVHRQAKIDSGKQAAEDAEVFINKLREEAKTMGMTEEEKERYKIATMNASASVLEAVDAQMKLNEQLKETAKVKAEMKKMAESLQNELETMNMKESERKVHDLLNKTPSLVNTPEAERLQKLADEVDAAKELKKMREEGKKLNEQYAPPAEKMATEQDKLNKMLEAGAITAETYAKKMNDVRKGIDGVKTAMQDAARFGSAEAYKRIYDFLDNKGSIKPPNKVDQAAFSTVGMTSRQIQLNEEAEGRKIYDPGASDIGGGPSGWLGRLLERVARASEKTAGKEEWVVTPMNAEE